MRDDSVDKARRVARKIADHGKFWIVSMEVEAMVYAHDANEALEVAASEGALQEEMSYYSIRHDAHAHPATHLLSGGSLNEIPWGESDDRTIGEILGEADDA